MGMDVFGKKAEGEKGHYFRNNVWWWRPLWDYTCEVAGVYIGPAVADGGHSNSGDGLDGPTSRKVAKLLRAELESGRTKAYAEKYAAELAQIPQQECELCGGTGTRSKPVPGDPGWKPKPGECNGCDGKGKKDAIETWYPFSVENVTEWVEFLEHCDGFEIY